MTYTPPDDNGILFKVAELIRVLMDIDENSDEILIGRENIAIKDYDKRLIIVDEIPAANPVSNAERYDGEAETMAFLTTFRHDITVDVQGKTAYSDATRLVGMIRSQLAHDTKNTLGITGFAVSSKTDLKGLTGTQNINRIQLACVVHNCETVEIETMRIDVARFKIINEKGTIHDSQSE